MVDVSVADVYARLGVRRVINACSTFTRLGGGPLAPEVTDAMAQATRHCVDVNQLLAKSGDYIAHMLGVEAAYVCAGSAAGLMLSTAACVAGDNQAFIKRLPDTRGMPNQVVVHRNHRLGYDQAVRTVGIELVEFGWTKDTFPWQLEEAITDQTAAVIYFPEFIPRGGCLPLETVLKIAHQHDVPVIVDAAAELPPISNLHDYCDLGADLVIFSGGKDIGAPQSTGLILGRRDLIEKCALNGFPNYSIGRPMKVCKEEIIGLIAALELYLAQDREAEDAQWEAQVATMVVILDALPGVNARRVSPVPPGNSPLTIPRVFVEWNAGALGLTVEEAQAELYSGDPRIAVDDTFTSALVLNPQVLAPGEEKIVAQRISQVLRPRQETA